MGEFILTSDVNKMYHGILNAGPGHPFLEGKKGERHFQSDIIWNGYTDHFAGFELSGRYLAEKDYETGRPMVILWPRDPFPGDDYIDIYYNERLVQYPISFLGHNAVNVNGEVFNFSVTMNENEVLTPEEYLYRPALGEFSPDPVKGGQNLDNPECPYYDKFGRRFMRSVHVLRILGLDIKRFSAIFHEEMEAIQNTPVHPDRPGKYRDFHFLKRNCTTIIRDCLRKGGLEGIHGVFPRDFLANTAAAIEKHGPGQGLSMKLYKLEQLKVSEAPHSVITPYMNPLNILRERNVKNLV